MIVNVGGDLGTCTFFECTQKGVRSVGLHQTRKWKVGCREHEYILRYWLMRSSLAMPNYDRSWLDRLYERKTRRSYQLQMQL